MVQKQNVSVGWQMLFSVLPVVAFDRNTGKQNAHMNVNEPSLTEISNRNAHKIVSAFNETYASDGKNDIFIVLNIITRNNGKIYDLPFAVDVDSYDYYLPIFRKMMDTFEIISLFYLFCY